MRKIMILLFILVLSSLAWGQIISQYIETNSGGSPKGIEVWNNTDSVLDFSANPLVIKKGVNGGTPQTDFTLDTGSLAVGDVMVIGTSDLQSVTEANGSAFYSKGFSFNGDDALEVWYGTTKTDVFGTSGVDPGSEWAGNGVSTKNQNIQLLTGITVGDLDGWTDPSERFETVSTNPVADMTGFGIAPLSGGGNALPSITNIIIDPTIPQATDAVTVSADVTDSDGVITNVTLSWSIDETNFTDINMSLDTGSTYISDTAIPAQAAGITVYYKIQATDDEPETSISAVRTYTIPAEYTIYQIQGQQETSPHVGESVMTSGIVTATFTSYFVIQDGSTAWNGLWVSSSEVVNIGDNVTISGTISEDYSYGDIGNTIIEAMEITINSSSNRLPNAITLTTVEVAEEQYEGMLISVENAQCTSVDLGYGVWEVNDGSGACRIDDSAYSYSPTLGTLYDVTGVLRYSYGNFNIEPRYEADVVVLEDYIAPEILSVTVLSSTSIAVNFNEEVDQVSAETSTNYTIDGLTVTGAIKNVTEVTQVILSVSEMSNTTYTLVVNNVEDLNGNAIVNGTVDFEYFSLPETGDVIINEIGEPYEMANTYNSSYIELYNTTDYEIDISGWIVNSIESSRATSSFTFPEGTTIAANGYILATRNRTSFLADYGTYVDESIVPVAESTTGSGVYIGNNYYFTLEMLNGTVLESTSSTVSWNSSVYERIDPIVAANEDTNWQLTYQSEPVQGTPGAANSTVPASTEYTIYQIQTEDHTGEMVITAGIVTAVFESEFTIQDGVGAFNGIWISSDETVTLGDNLTIEGMVSENNGKTIITATSVTIVSSGNTLPEAVTLTTIAVSTEDYEGVFVHTTGVCDNADLGYGEWSIDDGSGSVRINDLGVAITPTQDYSYDVTGVVDYNYGNFKIEPRTEADVIETASDANPPTIVSANAITNTSVDVIFSEDVEQTTAETSTNYTIQGLIVNSAALDITDATKVTLTVSEMAEQEYTLVVNNVEDLNGNAIVEGNINFSYTAPQIAGNILINEFDTNASSYEYIELYNTTESEIDLASANYSLVFYNGNGDIEYQTTELTGTIPAYGFYVLAENGVTDLYGYIPDQNATWTAFQNGTDAIALVSGDDQIDAVIYGSSADTGLESLLNLPDILVPNNSTSSTGRLSDGQGGANYANSDWDILSERTPGATNSTSITLDSPTNIQISHDGTNVNITWDAVTGAVSYKIMVCDTPDGEYILAAEGITGTTWSNIEASNKKFYRVIAVN